MKVVRLACLALFALALAAPLSVAELGMKAPALQISEWVKGAAVDVTVGDGKSIFLVEFWATWCPPCRSSIPHLTQLQKKYKDKHLTVIGVSKEGVKTVKPFVDKQGDKMDYVVAVDKNQASFKAYMNAFGQSGIPHAFLIDQQGRIIWHDHPMADFESIIDKLIAGEFTLEQAQAWRTGRARAAQLREMAEQYLRQAYDAAFDQDSLAKLGRKIVENGKSDESLMNDFAWVLMNDSRIANPDLKLALQAARYGYDLTKGEDPSNVETYALALYKTGDKQKALELQTKAVELAKTQKVDERIFKAMVERLEQFKNGAD